MKMRMRLLVGVVALMPAAALAIPEGAFESAAAAPYGQSRQQVSSRWGAAQEIPGTAALNTGKNADTASISCPSAGDCASGGSYLDSSGHTQAYVVDETNGTWGNARKMPGIAALNTGGTAAVDSISCASAGNCAAAGTYLDSSGHTQAYVVDETNGTWGKAIEMPGIAALNVGGTVAVDSLSCGSAGDCAAGGSYVDGSGSTQAFVTNETNGIWANAIEVPGTATLNAGGSGVTYSLSCASAGNCTAGGKYTTSGDASFPAFVVDETNGTWGNAMEVPGFATLTDLQDGLVGSISCKSAGSCSATGIYATPPGQFHQPYEVFVVDETNGIWGNAIELPAIATLATGGNAGVPSGLSPPISCATVGNCGVAGIYEKSSGRWGGFVANETNGSWENTIAMPGVGTLATGGGPLDFQSISCPSVGDCGAGGYYQDRSGDVHAFVVKETTGTWRTPIQVPGTAALATGGYIAVNSISCGSAGNCAAVGQYFAGYNGPHNRANNEVFVVNQS